ncbi:MAG: hypothetical protein JSR65_01140 [Proteobacteria bacterium]|nr:hypothetical protein [Pseudomonadota bacterium]
MASTVALCPRPGLACGPEFPVELLRDRSWTLDKLPEGAFAFEAAHWVVPTSTFKAVDDDEEYVDGQSRGLRERIERRWWGERYDRVAAARAAGDANVAYAAAQGLPEEARRYLAGALAWSKRDADEAQRRFRSVLDLPPAERSHYGLWAQFMLARSADVHAAMALYAALRDDVARGASDPYGLAVASLGEEARLHLAAGEQTAAIALYAQQAALGSRSGRDSLLQIARKAIKDPAQVERLVRDDLGQRLLTAYLYTRSGELSDDEIDGESPPEEVARSKAAAEQRMQRFLDAATHAGIDNVAGADRLAALAYRSGQYELAARLAQKDASGLAWWVRAKLALRAGKADEAAQAYAQAAKAFPANEEWGTNSDAAEFGDETIKPQCRIEGERGTLALSRGDYLAAMEHLYNAASLYWPDAAYLAERVLSVDELKSFVDAHAPRVDNKPAAVEGDGMARDEAPTPPAMRLRALLGRRLLRAERYDDALRYFDDAGLNKKARTYVDARRAAMRGDRIERAQAWYVAAHAARFDGIDLIGYELDPDYQAYAGEFDLGGGGSAAEVDATATDMSGTGSSERKDIVVPEKWAGAEEAARVASSRAQPLERFHYRYDAVAFASKSADLLPPRTQAFAAVLCHATAWMIDRDSSVADKLYARYLKQGPYVAWGRNFGRTCPEPDFDAAAARWHAERVAEWKRALKRAAPYALGGCVVLLLGVVWAWRRRGKSRSAAV